MPQLTRTILLPLALLISTGCTAPGGHELTAASFGSDRTTRVDSDPDPIRPTPIERLEIVSVGPTRGGVEQAGAIGARSVEPGPPTPDPAATATSASVLVDGKVGDVNGRPVFARTFFRQQQLEGRLRAEARKFGEEDREGFREAAAGIISDAVRDFVENEVIYRERRFSLSEEQTRNLRSALRLLEEQLSGRSRGSRAEAERRLQEEQGLTTDEYIDKVERDELIRDQINEAIAGLDEPSQHEVRTFYLNNRELFHPDPLATVRMIWLSADDEAVIEQVRARLEAGESFEEIAGEGLNRFNRSGSGLLGDQPIEFAPPLAEATLTEIEPLNAELTSLEPGGWAGPIPFTTSSGTERVGFVFLQDVEELSIPFVDAQLRIAFVLKQQKRVLAKNRYLRRVLDGSSYTGIEDMTSRLVRIAEENYIGPVPDAG